MYVANSLNMMFAGTQETLGKIQQLFATHSIMFYLIDFVLKTSTFDCVMRISYVKKFCPWGKVSSAN